MIDRAFAKVLKRYRQERHLSQEALAAAAGLHRTYISQLERHLKSPSLHTVYQLIQVLQVDLAEFMTAVQAELDA